MRMPPDSLLEAMMDRCGAETAAEMAIPSYLHPNPVIRWMATSRVHLLSRWLRESMRPDGRVLDFGCGTGVLLPVASRSAREVLAVDLELGPATMLVEHYQLRNVRLLSANLMDELEHGSIDVIVCGEVLEHIADLAPTLVSFRRLLVPRGRLLVSLPTENMLYRFGRRLDGFSGEYHVGTARSICTRIEKAGFVARKRRSLPLPGPFAIYRAVDYVAPST